jgi:uncharacterized membrane protein YidH (DUF202 family)
VEKKKFMRLVSRRVLTEGELEQFISEAKSSASRLEDVLLRAGMPKHEMLLSLSAYYGYPYVEYDESVIISQQLIRRMDVEQLKRSLWLPLSVMDDRAEVIASYPDDPEVLNEIKTTLHVETLVFNIALPNDLVRIIEHNQDLNPGFPPVAGRTPLAKVRTFLAERRSSLSCQRTALAKGRTGLAFLRTGLSFITISLVLVRLFGTGYLSIAEIIFFAIGLIGVIDGLSWYLPARRLGKERFIYRATEPTGGTSVLTAAPDQGDLTKFLRSTKVPGAAELRQQWNRLSPVMRRRFLASDRTDLAEERTVLASYRTLMARARTGLSFTRTGAAFIGLGIALLRQFRSGPWSALDALIIFMGAAMVAEGFYWYLPGRKAGREGAHAVSAAETRRSIWEEVFPDLLHSRTFAAMRAPLPPVKGYASPGIWATTGLALERTLLADRRNVMARVRTVMARSRTGLSLIRTGMSITGIGLGLLVYFGAGSVSWTVLETAMIAAGLLFIADGFSWYNAAERTRKTFPYCFGELEIAVPDYGTPARAWRKAVFSDDDV